MPTNKKSETIPNPAFDNMLASLAPIGSLVSENLKIREMGSTQIEEYLKGIWETQYNRNTGIFLVNHNLIIRTCQRIYGQLTGKPVLINICDEITNDVKAIEEAQKEL